MEKIWIVTYWDNGEEPVVTPFDNIEAANNCYNYFKKQHDGCCIDPCTIFKVFMPTNEV